MTMPFNGLTSDELKRQVCSTPACFEQRMAALADYGLAEPPPVYLGGVLLPRTLAEPPAHLEGGVAGDADAGQVLDPDIEEDEPEGHAEKIAFWKEIAMWTESGQQYARAQAHLLALGVDQSADAQAIADSTAASRARGERQAAAPSPLAAAQAAARDEFAANLVSPFAQVVPVEVLMRDPRSGLTAWVPQKSLTRAQAVTVAEKVAGQINLRESGALVPTRKVMVKEVLARDSNGDVLRVKEYSVDEPIPPDGTPPAEPTRLAEPTVSYTVPLVQPPGDL